MHIHDSPTCPLFSLFVVSILLTFTYLQPPLSIVQHSPWTMLLANQSSGSLDMRLNPSSQRSWTSSSPQVITCTVYDAILKVGSFLDFQLMNLKPRRKRLPCTRHSCPYMHGYTSISSSSRVLYTKTVWSSLRLLTTHDAYILVHLGQANLKPQAMGEKLNENDRRMSGLNTMCLFSFSRPDGKSFWAIRCNQVLNGPQDSGRILVSELIDCPIPRTQQTPGKGFENFHRWIQSTSGF